MKKSKFIILGSAFLSAVSLVSCKKEPKDEWLTSKERQDTVINNSSYHYYGGFWYPLIGGRYNPGRYDGFSSSEMRSGRATVRTSTHIRSGGFGSSSHSSSHSFGG